MGEAQRGAGAAGLLRGPRHRRPALLAALIDRLHALGRDTDLSVVRPRLTEARDQHREVYAEARMRLPERVPGHAGDVSHDLGAVYGMVRRLDDGARRPGDSPAAVQEVVETPCGTGCVRCATRCGRIWATPGHSPGVERKKRGSRRPARGGSA
ncbi:hypothetical protein ACFWVP_04790 [Streptomyces sp. NPDC058637]|uniref:hypothetical protein n=1 Tax=Streptomyces sp. NPDC058637 TaxID=3346569 RepID=UPI003647D103